MQNLTLTCLRCSGAPQLPVSAWRCPFCHGPLAWPGPAAFRTTDIDHSRDYIWRYAAALPPIEPQVSFGERATPLTSLDLGNATVSAKLESINPTTSFKDRGFALLVNALQGAGVSGLVEDSSGNAAASLAGYAARAGIPCRIYAPARASAGKLIQAAAYGADVVRVEGSRADVAAAAERAHDPEGGTMYASHNWHPLFVTGVMTWALELWEQRGCTAPGAIIAPAGSGSLILGAFAAFEMLAAGGEIGRLPRIFAAQPAACAPFVHALEHGLADVEVFDQQPTLAEGASIAKPVRGRDVLAALRGSAGGAVAIQEGALIEATLRAARQGLFVEPTSALAIAAAKSLVQNGHVPAGMDTVVVVTGSGLKTQGAIAELLDEERRQRGGSVISAKNSSSRD